MELALAVIGGAAALAAFSAVAAVFIRAPDKYRHMLRQMPAKRIADLGDGELGKAVGRARVVDQSLTAPLSGRRCIYYIAEVWDHSTQKHIIREARAVVFALEDDSGLALVDAMGARIELDVAKSASDTFHDPTDAQRAFLARFDEPVHGWFFARSLQYSEAVIEDGKTIAVLGAGTREPDPEAPPTDAYRGEPRTRLRLTSSRKHPLAISDHPAALH